MAAPPQQASKSQAGPLPSATVTPLPNGPLKVEGARVLSPDGTEISNKDPVFLCRCGHSENKPFCDGHHAKVAFKA